MNNVGGIIKNSKLIELVNKEFNKDMTIADYFKQSYRRWVKCPECNNLFETWSKDNHWCPFCSFKGDCNTAIQTIHY